MVFIGGCSRSGTTLVREILDRHPKLACSVETALFVPAFEARRVAERSAVDLAEVERLVASSRHLVEFAERYFEQYVGHDRARRWVEKCPHNVRVAGQLLTWFPHAVFLHLVRDGRDVVCSLRTHPSERLVDGVAVPVVSRNSIASCCRSWVQETSYGMALRGHPRYRELRYKELVGDPERTVRDLCRFIGEDFASTMIEGRSRPGPPSRLLANANAAGAITVDRLGRWRRELSAGERRLFVHLAGARLRELGYVENHGWVSADCAAPPSGDNVATALLKSAVAAHGRDARLSVRGGCMAPLVVDGDVVTVTGAGGPPPPGSLVVVEVDPGELVCHRLIRRAEDGVLLVRGDRASADQEVAPGDLVGAVCRVQRGAVALAMTGSAWRVAGAVSRLEARTRRSPRWWVRRLLGAGLRRCLAAAGWWLWSLAARRGSDHEKSSTGAA